MTTIRRRPEHRASHSFAPSIGDFAYFNAVVSVTVAWRSTHPKCAMNNHPPGPFLASPARFRWGLFEMNGTILMR